MNPQGVRIEGDEELDRAVAAMREAEVVALACHVNPDGDALGSLLAMHHLCRAHGVESVASWPTPFDVAPHYRFLPGLDLATKPDDFPAAPEVMLTFDCGSMDRLGELADNARRAGELIVIDHHATNDRYGTINVVDPDAAASVVIVRRIAAAFGWSLTREAAECLYTGLITDTGRFQYQNTTPDVFDFARELVTFDLPISAMSRELFERHRFTYLQMVGEVLARAELDERHGFVYAVVSAEDLERHQVAVEETEGLIDLVRRTSEAEVSAVLKETPEGVRVSLRSIQEVDVAALAMKFGGGGHRFAAGFTSQEDVATVVEMIRSELPTT